METVKKLQDIYGKNIIKGTKVVVLDECTLTGIITTLYDDGSVDIHHDDSHQGAVIDSFDIIQRQVCTIQ